MKDKISDIKPKASTEDLEAQILNLRKLHAESLQMLVIMGKDLLNTQQTLLTAVADMRLVYDRFAEFIQVNAAHLPDVEEEDVPSK
jgi:hypothetical protein